nr:hypothetical protein CFP56_02704 [Quercus suber]
MAHASFSRGDSTFKKPSLSATSIIQRQSDGLSVLVQELQDQIEHQKEEIRRIKEEQKTSHTSERPIYIVEIKSPIQFCGAVLLSLSEGKSEVGPYRAPSLADAHRSLRYLGPHHSRLCDKDRASVTALVTAPVTVPATVPDNTTSRSVLNLQQLNIQSNSLTTADCTLS